MDVDDDKAAPIMASALLPAPHLLDRVERQSRVGIGAPARISAATQIASMISSAVAPCRSAAFVWPRMQYGHCVMCAAATAMSCLVLVGRAPAAKTC